MPFNAGIAPAPGGAPGPSLSVSLLSPTPAIWQSPGPDFGISLPVSRPLPRNPKKKAWLTTFLAIRFLQVPLLLHRNSYFSILANLVRGRSFTVQITRRWRKLSRSACLLRPCWDSSWLPSSSLSTSSGYKSLLSTDVGLWIKSVDWAFGLVSLVSLIERKKKKLEGILMEISYHLLLLRSIEGK